MEFFMQINPLIIISVGAFIAFLVVMYYVVKMQAKVMGLYEAKAERLANLKPVTDRDPYFKYEFVFKNGNTYNFSGVELDIELDDETGEVIDFNTKHNDPSNDELDDVQLQQKYNQSLRYVNFSEILYINQVIQY